MWSIDFLIVGMERSGTLWTSAILNAHPEIASFPNLPFNKRTGGTREIGEAHFFNTIASLESGAGGMFTRPIENFRTFYNREYADVMEQYKKIPMREFQELLFKRYCERYSSFKGDKRLVGESTAAYVFHLDFIDSFFPKGVKKICSIRDPKDKIVSWHFSLLAKGRKKEKIISENFVKEYLHERVLPEYKALLNYNGYVHCITYENLHRAPVATVSGILEYLKVPASKEIVERMVDYASFEKQTARDDGGDGRKEGLEDTKSQMRKGIVGDWKNHINKELATLIDHEVGGVREKVFQKYHLAGVRS